MFYVFPFSQKHQDCVPELLSDILKPYLYFNKLADTDKPLYFKGTWSLNDFTLFQVPVKANSLGRMKAIFVQEIFTEQVVASHAVSVSVTKELNANLTGYLPVHCIYQLLKSRAFSKHKVSIRVSTCSMSALFK